MRPVSLRRPCRSGAAGHRREVPEVTLCTRAIADAACAPQHGGMRESLARLLHPLNLAGFATWLAVAMVVRHGDAPAWRNELLLAAWLLAFLAANALGDRRGRLRLAAFAIEAASALALVGLADNRSTAPVLLVVLVAQLAMTYPLRTVLPAAVMLNFGVYLLLGRDGHPNPLALVLSYGGFQLFAALTSHYARSAEDARDRLAQVNADLLATRALLAESARDGERLRVARELHDVAGHKLTALRLNLRALQAASPSPQLQLVEQLSAELMGDIRGVVHALRDAHGLDIDTALRALAAPYPRPALQLSIDDDVLVADPALAEAVLRTVQEALTNAARHGQANLLDVRVHRDGAALRVDIEDDGRATLPLREGHGLTGMRERIAALGGDLRIDRAARGGVRIEARLPT
ncbi:MAG TPA: histidine kinase [Thermomonas sp.]|nr:histidine kinase [Thermomonas sp.]